MRYHLQKSFAGGELSPKLWLRNDSPIHRASVKKLHNMLAEPHGPASSRLGFEFIEDLGPEEPCRIFDFIVQRSDPFAIVATKSKFIILDRTGSSLGNEFIDNFSFDDNGTGWTSFNTSFSSDSLAKLTPKLIIETDPEPGVPDVSYFQSAYIRQEVTVDNPLNPHQINIVSVNPNNDTPFLIKIGTNEGTNDILSTTSSGSNISINITPGIATFWIQLETIFDTSEVKNIDKVNLAEIVQTPGTGSLVELPLATPYTDTDLKELQVEMVPNENTMYLVTRGHEPVFINYDGAVWTQNVISFNHGTGDDPWETFYPGCITFHDGRLALGGTLAAPVTVWLSKPFDYTNFDKGASDTADDALELPLSKNGQLVWLQSNTRLFAGLDTGEHIIFGTNGPIAVNNAQTEQQSAYGSSRAHAVVIEEQVVYIDTRGKTVRAAQYSRDQNAFISENLSFQAEHITEEGLFELEYGISPINSIWFPTLDGNFVSVNLEKSQQTIGWQSHDTDGRIQSMAIMREFGVSVPWIAVVRNGRLLIERMSYNNEMQVDSGKTISVASPTKVFTGFNHLANLRVQVVADGKVHPEVLVSAEGEITLNYEATTIVAGLQFIPEFETLPNQTFSDQGDTTAFTKRFSELAIYMIDSPLPIVNEFDLFLRSERTPMDTREKSFTGLITFGNLDSWSNEATIKVSQPLPLPLRFSAIGGKLKENKV